MTRLAEGQPVTMRVVDTPKGREALSISVGISRMSVDRRGACDRSSRLPRMRRLTHGDAHGALAAVAAILAVCSRSWRPCARPRAAAPGISQQDFASIAPYTIEEAYEVADAIERGDLADLKDELGDLLLQVVFHARMAEERGAFDFGGVVEAITAKLLRRHPHVFGDLGRLYAGRSRALWAAHQSARSGETRARRTEPRGRACSPTCRSPSPP